MAENSWPFENADTTEIQFSKWASALAESGPITGLDVTLASGMTVNVGVGTGIVRGMFYENTTAKALTIGAAPVAGQTRLDQIVLKLDLAGNTVSAVVRAGTANTGGGALPALTQNDTVWEHPLRTITVPGGVASLVTGNIGPVTPPTGMRVVPYVGAPPALTGTARALGLNLTSKRLSYWDGAAWGELSAAVAWADLAGKPATFSPSAHTHTISEITDIGNATVANALKVGGRTIFVQSGTPAGAVSGDLWFW